MSKLKEEKLLEVLNSLRIGNNIFLFTDKTKAEQDKMVNQPFWIRNEQAIQQIKEMIQKPEVTEGWIDNFVEEKARIFFRDYSMDTIRDFIRLIVKEIQGGIDG